MPDFPWFSTSIGRKCRTDPLCVTLWDCDEASGLLRVLASVCKGNLSRPASRIIAPLARAKGEHATAMVKYLEHHPLSTRELTLWNNHYQKASRPVRDAMVKDPALFLSALTNKEQEKQDHTLAAGPEGACRT